MLFWKSQNLRRVSPEKAEESTSGHTFSKPRWVRAPYLVVLFVFMIWGFHMALYYPQSLEGFVDAGGRLFLTAACVFSFYGLLHVEENPVLRSVPRLVLYGLLLFVTIGITGCVLRFQSKAFSHRTTMFNIEDNISVQKPVENADTQENWGPEGEAGGDQSYQEAHRSFLMSIKSVYLVPLTLLSMLIAVGFTTSLAIESLFFMFILVGLLWGAELQFSSYLVGAGHHWFLLGIISCLPGSVVGALLSADIRRRTKPLEAGVLAGLIHCLIFLLLLVVIVPGSYLVSLNISSSPFLKMAITASYALLNGVISGAFLVLVLPFAEKLFGMKTDLGLLELTDMNRPALRKLALDAPGTYHHSLRVGTLSEEAAEAIGANPLLARVGAYYHDIGKVTKPQYFIENQQGEVSPHADLPSNMSKLILLGHVKDGLELAEYYGLPGSLKDFIEQHHGTSVIEYFFDKERKIQRRKPEGQEVETANFRYPGPKPQTKEIGICMLADSVEATSRSLDDPSPGQIEGMVERIIEKRLLDGQLDESGLTMGDIKVIKRSFLEVLTGMMHVRVKYPGQKPEKTNEEKRQEPESRIHEKQTERISREELLQEKKQEVELEEGPPEEDQETDFSSPLPNQIDILNQQDEIPVETQELVELAMFVLEAEGIEKRISVALVSRDEIQQLHKSYLGKDHPTDVLSFPLDRDEDSSPDDLLGEIVISPLEARMNARENELSTEEEIQLYLIHGILHLLGYDDQDDQDRQKMKTREQELLESFQGQLSLSEQEKNGEGE